MNNSSITPAKLAQVAAMVAAQKAKSDASKSTPKVVSVRDQAELDAKKAVLIAERDARKVARVEARTARQSQLETLRATKKAERLAKKAEKGGGEGVLPTFQRKIERLQNALPEQTENQTALLELIKDFTDIELTNSLAFVEFERRQRAILATENAKGTVTLNVGDSVLIKNCNARKFIGQVGVVSMVRRVRAFVEVPGFDTTAYVWTTDVEVLPAVAENEEATFTSVTIDETQEPETLDTNEEVDENCLDNEDEEQVAEAV